MPGDTSGLGRLPQHLLLRWRERAGLRSRVSPTPRRGVSVPKPAYFVKLAPSGLLSVIELDCRRLLIEFMDMTFDIECAFLEVPFLSLPADMEPVRFLGGWWGRPTNPTPRCGSPGGRRRWAGGATGQHPRGTAAAAAAAAGRVGAPRRRVSPRRGGLFCRRRRI